MNQDQLQPPGEDQREVAHSRAEPLRKLSNGALRWVALISAIGLAMVLLSLSEKDGWQLLGWDPKGKGWRDALRVVGGAIMSGGMIASVLFYFQNRIQTQLDKLQQKQTSVLAAQQQRHLLATHLALERDLRGRNLEGKDMQNIVLAGRDLTDANLNGANLAGANLRHATLKRTKLCGCNLDGVDFTGADLTLAEFNGRQAEPERDRIAGVVPERVSVSMYYGPSTLNQAILIGANCRRAFLECVDLSVVKPADMSGTRFYDARLAQARLPPGLKDANLAGADLTEVDLSGVVGFCSIEGADLTNAVLPKDRLAGVYLHEVTLTGVDLCGADLRCTENLQDAILDGAFYDAGTQWPDGFRPPRTAIRVSKSPLDSFIRWLGRS